MVIFPVVISPIEITNGRDGVFFIVDEWIFENILLEDNQWWYFLFVHREQFLSLMVCIMAGNLLSTFRYPCEKD